MNTPKPRSLSVGENEWQRFSETAKALGISKSELFKRIWLTWIGEPSNSQSKIKSSEQPVLRRFTSKASSQE